MKNKDVKAFIDNLPNDVSNFILQDVPRWVEVLRYKESDPFEFFIKLGRSFVV